MDAHHVIDKQQCRSRGLPLYALDNCLPLCRPCHEGHTSHMHKLTRDVLRPENIEFAKEHGLLWWVTREYPLKESPLK
jgi:hypothetical protein